jgi:hypothetical protein
MGAVNSCFLLHRLGSGGAEDKSPTFTEATFSARLGEEVLNFKDHRFRWFSSALIIFSEPQSGRIQGQVAMWLRLSVRQSLTLARMGSEPSVLWLESFPG